MANNKKDMLSSGLMDVLGSFATETPSQEKEPAKQEIKESKPKAEKKEEAKAEPKAETRKDQAAARRLWSFRVKEEVYQKITAISYWDRESIQTVMDALLDEAIASYESKNGKIKPVKK